VPEVVGKKAELDEHVGQVNGVRELKPGATEDRQQGEAHREQAEAQGDLAAEVGGLAVQQPVLLDDPLQVGVGVGGRLGRGPLI